MTCYMSNQLLRDADWAGMAHSLEIRVPLVDVALFRAILPLLLLDSPCSKRDMAIIPKKAMPFEVLNRQKTGFSVPVREWLMEGSSGNVRERGLRGWARKLYGNWSIL